MNYHDLIRSPILPPDVAKRVEKCARTQTPVLILGEQGTGKELIAKILHHAGGTEAHLFYRIDCRLLKKEDLLAHLLPFLEKTHFGRIPATLYIEEVGHLHPRDQLKLLELIEDGVIHNGAEKKTVQNIRILSSSSENLEEKVDRGDFSEDLLLKLKTISIYLPPLRERKGEIGAIAQYLLHMHIKEKKIRSIGISKEVLRVLENYWWPGNLREMEHVLIRGAILSEGEEITERDLSLEPELGLPPFPAFLKKTGSAKNGGVKDRTSNGLQIWDNSLFFLELVHRIKNPLVSIKTFTQLLRDKFQDPEFRNTFYRIVTEDIEKIDAVLSGLLNYIRINHPIEKKDTVHALLEEILKKHQATFESRGIKLFKKFEEGLPETILHEEQLRYILTSLIQYALPSIPKSGTLGVLTKSLRDGEDDGKGSPSLPGERRYIEILVVFTGYKKPGEPLGSLLGLPAKQVEELADMEIRLVKEMVERNRGRMIIEANPKKLRTYISLKLPVERRRVITYQLPNS
ncbi:MAG: sigma 54-interacting transcriptional regulator [Desulfobacterota bacterium]|nr:sigma 54-interacting transcriptional regulator [Thermodesulfobacteriota bacterium]